MFTPPTRPADPLRQTFALAPAPAPAGPYTYPYTWLPARTRAVLSRTIQRRNALDRTLAVTRGVDPASPDCARFQGAEACAALDRAVRKATRP